MGENKMISYNQSVIYAAEKFAKVIKEYMKIIHKKHNIPINHNEYIILEEIVFNPGITQGDLARSLSIQRTYVSKILSSLEDREYITREQEKKSKQIIAVKSYPTEKGKEVHRNSRKILVQEAYEIFSEKERDELEDVGNILFKQINKITKIYNIKF